MVESSRTFLPVKNDAVFRLFFGDERNVEFLESFLKSVLKLPETEYEALEIVDPHLLRESLREGALDKLAIIDVKLRTKSGNVINIEMQLDLKPDLKQRIVFYDAKLITEQLKDGESYGNLNRVITILVTEDALFASDQRYHHRFTFYDKEAQVEFSDMIEINTLELSKLPKSKDGTLLYDWASFIAADTEERLTMASVNSPVIQKAVLKLRELSADEETRELYELREKARRDEIWIREGGRKEGRQEGRQEVAKKLLAKQRPIDEIMDVTDLTRDEIEKLRCFN